MDRFDNRVNFRGGDGSIGLVIIGEPCSKANSRKIVTLARGKPHERSAVVKSKAALSYERSASLQVPKLSPLLAGPLSATIRIWYATERPDLDESIVLDVLQGRIYANDRQVREKHVYHAIDRANPRAEITVKPLTAQQAAIDLPSEAQDAI